MNGIDILLLAVVAGILIFRLYSVLGQEDEETLERIKNLQKILNEDMAEETTSLQEDPHQKFASFLKTRSVKERQIIQDLWQSWPEFDPDKFLKGAQKAFVMIVEEFAQGNMRELEGLVSPLLRKQFQEVIERRNKQGEKHETRVENIKSLQIHSAQNIDGFVTIALDVHSFQSYTVTNKKGDILHETKEDLEELWDRWTFSRDVRTKKPSWLLTNIEQVPDAERV